MKLVNTYAEILLFTIVAKEASKALLVILTFVSSCRRRAVTFLEYASNSPLVVPFALISPSFRGMLIEADSRPLGWGFKLWLDVILEDLPQLFLLLLFILSGIDVSPSGWVSFSASIVVLLIGILRASMAGLQSCWRCCKRSAGKSQAASRSDVGSESRSPSNVQLLPQGNQR